MIHPRPKEWSNFARADDLNCNLLHAHYIDHSFDRHIHCDYAIGIIVGGVEKFWCEGETYLAKAGTIVLVNPFEVHDGCAGIDDGFVYRMFYFSPQDYTRILNDAGMKNARPPRFNNHIVEDPELFHQMFHLHASLQNEPDPLLRQQSWVSTLCQLAFRHGQFPQTASGLKANTPGILRMQEYLHDNLTSPITLDELANTANLSTFQALRHFKANFGITPHRYLTNIRLFKAQNLLVDGKALVEVASSCGFADQAHLTRWFKRIYGVTPGKFAQACHTSRNNVQDDQTFMP